MAKELPSKFPIKTLTKFQFGDEDGFRDEYLFAAFCYTDFIEQTRANNKTLLIGSKGSGKSAVFKAYLDGKLKPSISDKCDVLILGISDELKYIDIDKIIKENLSIYGYSDEFKYALVWDIYIIFRIVLELQKKYSDSFGINLKKLASFFKHIGIKEQMSLSIFLDKIKNVKFSASVSDGACIYTGSYEHSAEEEKDDPSNFALYSLKEEINNILTEYNVCMWVMLDKLDDFLIREEYDVQRKLLQGLVVTEDSYAKYSQMFIKIFLRSDLYEKIDFSVIGSDKIPGRRVIFEWTRTEIRRLIAQRLAFNLFSALEIKSLSVNIDENVLKEDSSLSEKNVTDLYSERKLIDRLRGDKWQGRTISIDDQASRKLITMLFPHTVYHFNESAKKAPIDLFKFIDTHFNLGNNEPTPRILIRFLTLCFDCAKSYYSKNYDEGDNVLLDNGEYPLIKRPIFEDAYGRLTRETCENIKGFDPRWKRYIEKLFYIKGKKKTLSYSNIKTMLEIDDDKELNSLVSYLVHIGCLKCVDAKFSNIQKRKYHIPVFLQALDYYSKDELS